jgi:hypothetical protein
MDETLENARIRKLAKTYAAGVIDKADYRRQRNELIDAAEAQCNRRVENDQTLFLDELNIPVKMPDDLQGNSMQVAIVGLFVTLCVFFVLFYFM